MGCCQEPMLLVLSNPSSWTTLNLVVRNVESMTQSLVSDQISRGILKTYICFL